MTASIHGKLPMIGSVALIAVGGVVYAASKVSAPGWYDPAALAVSIRPEARAGLTAALGLPRPDDLTLYDLKLAYEEGAGTFTVGEEVWFTNTTRAPLDDLVLRIYANAAPPSTGPQVRFLDGACVGDNGCGLSLTTSSAIRVVPNVPIAPGGRLHFTLSLEGTLSRIDSSRTSIMAQGLEGLMSMLGGGAAAGDYGILGAGDGIVSFGNFYPVLARRVGAAWETDESSKLGDLGSDVVSNVRATIDLPSHARLAVTGVVTNEEAVRGRANLRRVHITAGAIRDFAVLFGNTMEVSARDVHGVHVMSYYLAADRVAGERVLEAAAKALETFEARFGPYPYANLSVSEQAIVGGAGGVEFSGLVTAASMFYRPIASAGASAGPLGGILQQLGGPAGLGGMTDGMLEFVVAHEVAHQWWHGLVGSDSRDHPYVDEALAQYSAIVYLEDRYGAARAEKDGTQNVKMNYQAMRMLGKDDLAADSPVSAFGGTVQYAGVVYGKAAYYYPAVRHAIGDTAFFDALRAYVARYRFREAPPRALPDLFAQAGGEGKMRPIERHWLEETHGDEDLGKLDLGSLLGGLGGAESGLPAGLGGDPQQLMKMIEQLSGMLGGAGGAGLPAAGAATGDPDVDAILKAFGGN